MFKYFIWVLKVFFPAIYHYGWIYRYSRHPEKYPLELRYRRARALILQFLRIVKVDIITIDMPKFTADQRYFLVGNHISFIDALVVIAMHEHPISFASKVESLKMPFVGRVIKIIDGVFLERDNLKQEIKVMQVIKKSMLAKTINWSIFPEGTRNKHYYAPMGEFKAGTFKLPVTTNTPVQPVAIWGSQVVLPKKIRWKRYPIYVKFLPQINPQDYEGNTQKIALASQQSIQAAVNDLRHEYPTLVAKYSKNKDFIKYLE